MNIAMQQIQQQHTMIKSQAHALLSKVKSAAPHSQLAQTMDHQVRTLEGMMAAGKSQASIDAQMKTMNQTIVNAQKQAYAPHYASQPAQSGHFGSSQFGQTGQHYGYGQQQVQGNAGHYQPAGQMAAAPMQSAGHFSPEPNLHTLNDARFAMHNMSKGFHGGYAKF